VNPHSFCWLILIPRETWLGWELALEQGRRLGEGSLLCLSDSGAVGKNLGEKACVGVWSLSMRPFCPRPDIQKRLG
jgi:hypothetical protein